MDAPLYGFQKICSIGTGALGLIQYLLGVCIFFVCPSSSQQKVDMQNLGEIFRYDHFNSTGFSFVAMIYFYRYEKQNKHMIYAFCILILLGRNVRNRMLVRFFTKSWQYHSLTRKNICAKNYLQLSLSKTKQCTHHFLRWYIQKCKAKTNEKVEVRLQNVLYNIWHILKKERAIQKRRAKNHWKKIAQM